MYFSGCNMNGGWDMDDAKRPYGEHSLPRGETKGGEAGSGRTGGHTVGRLARQMFFLVLALSLLAFLPSGTPLLVALGVPLGLSAGFALATYGILWLIARAFYKRR